MILVIEILFLIVGVYALVTAKMPSWMVGKGYKAEGNKVRWIGALMMVLLPGELCAGFTLGFAGGFAGFDPSGWAVGFEFVTVIIVAIIVSIVLRKIRVPDAQLESISTNIEPK